MNHAIGTTVKMILDDLTAALVEEVDGNQEEAFNCFGRVAGWFIDSDDSANWHGAPQREIHRARKMLARLIREAHEILGQPFPELTEALDYAAQRPEIVPVSRTDVDGATVLTGMVDGQLWTVISPDGEGPTVLVDPDGEPVTIDLFMPNFSDPADQKLNFIASTLAEQLA